MKQQYKMYTSEDHEVWNILFERQMKNLLEAASKEFIIGLPKIDFIPQAIPSFNHTSKLLRSLTGWSLQVVPGIVDDDIFFSLLSQKKFPATTWIRKMHQLDYLEEPDMFHDVFAHVPLLTNQNFVDFLQGLSKIALKHINNPIAIHLLSRIYWFTVEFGLIWEDRNLKIYGAGILSSAGESKFALSNKPVHMNFDVSKILETSYRKDTFQNIYFVIDSYEQLYKSLEEIDLKINKELLITH